MEGFRWRRWMLVLLLGLAPQGLAAADLLFVFHAGATASVYDSVSFELLASPTVGAGAVQAIGAPDPAQPGSLRKIYVITSSAVAVLDAAPPFALRRTLPLQGAIPDGERSAQLTPDGTKLLVLGGNFLHVFDALDAADRTLATINLGAAPNHLAVLSNSTRAYVTLPDSTAVSVISLTSAPPQRLANPIVLPEPPEAIAAAPNGAGLFAAAPGSLYEIDPVRSVLTATTASGAGVPLGLGFDPDAPVEVAFINQGSALTFLDFVRQTTQAIFLPQGSLTKALAPGGNLAYFLSSVTGRIYRGEIEGGSLALLQNPVTMTNFPLPAVDAELDLGNQNLFVAFGGSGELARLSATGSMLWNRLTPPLPPTGIAVVEAPGGRPSRLEIYGGNDQIAPIGSALPKPLAVRAIATSFRGGFGHQVTFTADADDVLFEPETAVTNLFGVAETRVTVPTDDVFKVEATVVPGNFTVTFDVNTGIPGLTGLRIDAGDYQITEGGTPFPRSFVVRASSGGVPLPSLDLTITPNSATVICPAMATTDSEGRASFLCSAAAVTMAGEFEIQVEDGSGRSLLEPFQAKVVPSPERLPRPQRLLRPLPPSAITGIVGEFKENAIEFEVAETQNGFPIPNVGIALASEGDITLTPDLAVSNLLGNARASVRFGCTTGNGEIVATMHSPGLPEVTIPFRVSAGPPSSLRKERGDNQAGAPGESLPLALLVRASDGCNHVTPGAPITWSVEPPGAATLRNAFGETNSFGQASTLVVLGNQGGPFTVVADIGAGSAVFNLSVTVTAAQMTIADGDGQTVMIGQPAARPLVVELRDANGVLAPGVEVRYRVTGGTATLSAPIAMTDASGRASTGLVAGAGLEPITVEARSGDLVRLFTLVVAGRTPVVTTAGFVNGASFVFGWAPGGTGSIFGSGLMEGVEGVVLPDAAPFPTILRGVQVLVENIPAPIISLANVNGQQQINIQVPFGVPAPAESVVVTIINNGTSATFSGIRTFRAMPGIFEFTLGAAKFAAALHADFRPVTPANPARPGEIILLFLTGGGPTTPEVGTNVPGPTPPARTVDPPTVFLDGARAEVLGGFYAPGFISAYQINFVIPADAAAGTLVLQVNIAGIPSQPTVIAVAP